MAYYHENIFQVWFKDSPEGQFVKDEWFYTEEEANAYCKMVSDEIDSHPEWEYTEYWFDIQVLDNPQYKT